MLYRECPAMATLSESRRLRAQSQQPDVDVRQIIAEAQLRWLRPVEVCEILKNYLKYGFKLNPVPPVRPGSGSMFLFDRKTLRYFRKDGHNWRKKKDGKTVREAHERLKTGSVDVLHCYYAHGEENTSFQRRCYWMLEPALEHIVLVHYREVTEQSRFTMTDSHTATAVHAASPPEVSNPSLSPELEHDDTDVVESEDVDDFTSLESGGTAQGQQHTLLDQISPRTQGATDTRGSSPVSNNWAGLEPPRSAAAAPSNNWLAGGSSGLAGIESLLNSPTGYTPRPLQHYEQHPNRQQPSSLLNNQQYASSSQDSVTLDTGGFTDMLSPDAYLGGQRQQNQAGTLDINAWNQLLEKSQRTSAPYSGQGTGNMGGSFGTQSSGGTGGPFGTQSSSSSSSLPPVYVKQESMNGSTWADMLEQCVTPATHRNIIESLMSNSPMDVNAANEQPSTQDLFSSQIPSPKGIMEALSPRGLGREPQTQLEASLRAVTEEKALKNAQRRFPGTRSDSQLLENVDGYPRLEILKSQEIEGFTKLDSFGRWMSNLSGDGQNFLGSSPLQSGWPGTPTIDDQGVGDDMYSISQQMQGEGLNTSVSSDQRYSIIDFSPEWAFASGGSKVLITGTFLRDYMNAADIKWCCMFGAVEVPAEVVGGGVLRCVAPPHGVGRVPFYVTSGDRQGHSEIREFEYRSGGRDLTDVKVVREAEGERLLKVRLARMLLSESNSTISWADTTAKQLNCLNSFASSYSEGDWEELEFLAGSSDSSKSALFHDRLLQMLLKSRMQKWLLCKIQEEGRGASVLDAQGQGVLHMASALGYDWAVAPIVAAGVPINFRDVHGWTALHWAAACGREEAVVALVGAGADPGTVTDPTPTCTAGQTPADLAAANGHVGIGGFLAENSLTRRLSTMSLSENPIDLAMSQIAGDTAVARLARRDSIKRSVSRAEDQLSIHESLQAVRNAAQAAALIQAAFRQHSFRKREEDDLTSMQFDDYGMTSSQMRALMAAKAAQRIQKAFRGHHEKKQHLAATRIQQKFRGWKVRRDFLNLRHRVVKLQAQVRGNLVRRRFKRLLWSVGILEKAVLRWRRKGAGLRGFKSGELSISGREDDEEFLKEGRKQNEVALEKAVTTVQSMVRSHQAREQYRRLREGSLKAEQLAQLSLPTSPQEFVSSADDQFQDYTQGQSTQHFLGSSNDHLMNFTD